MALELESGAHVE